MRNLKPKKLAVPSAVDTFRIVGNRLHTLGTTSPVASQQRMSDNKAGRCEQCVKRLTEHRCVERERCKEQTGKAAND